MSWEALTAAFVVIGAIFYLLERTDGGLDWLAFAAGGVCMIAIVFIQGWNMGITAVYGPAIRAADTKVQPVSDAIDAHIIDGNMPLAIGLFAIVLFSLPLVASQVRRSRGRPGE